MPILLDVSSLDPRRDRAVDISWRRVHREPASVAQPSHSQLRSVRKHRGSLRFGLDDDGPFPSTLQTASKTGRCLHSRVVLLHVDRLEPFDRRPSHYSPIVSFRVARF